MLVIYLMVLCTLFRINESQNKIFKSCYEVRVASYGRLPPILKHVFSIVARKENELCEVHVTL